MTAIKQKMICVEPVSRKAKNRFANEMDKLHSCVIEKEDGQFMFLSSISGRYFFWMHKSDDKDWRIIK